jgi:hypothetical protein
MVLILIYQTRLLAEDALKYKKQILDLRILLNNSIDQNMELEVQNNILKELLKSMPNQCSIGYKTILCWLFIMYH